MAVTGVFAADFSKFDSAVKQSATNLETLEQAGTKVESSLRLMTQSQEQMLDKIGASGGRIQGLGTAAGEASGKVGTLAESYRSFDGILGAVGINIAPQVKGLMDIGAAATAGAAGLGAMGTAGVVLATAYGSWKIGRMVADFFDLDQKIGDATASLLGFGDVAAETAGAQQDVINRAIAQGAQETISYTAAIKFNTEQGKINADAHIDWRLRLADTHRELRGLTETQKTEIAIAQEAGATTEQLTNKYGLSAAALELLATKQTAASAAAAQHTRELEVQAAALEKAYTKLMSDVKNANQLAIMEADAATAAAAAYNKKAEAGAGFMRAVEGVAKQTTEAAAAATAYATEQDALTAANDALWQSVDQVGASHTAAGAAASAGTAQTVAGYQAVQQQVELTSDGIRGWIELMRYTDRANAILMENSLFTTSSQLNRIAAGYLGGSIGAFGAPSFASGVQNFSGGLAKVHGGEVLANLAPGTSVFPKGGLGATVNNVFNLVDSESNLAKRVAEVIMRTIRSGTQLGTA